MTEIGPLQAGERKLATFDFSSEMAPELTIVSVTFTCEVWQGVDPAASTLLDSAPLKSGQKGMVWLKGGVVGVIYMIAGTATDDEGGIHVVQAKLRVLP